jgi:beta-mannosidase
VLPEQVQQFDGTRAYWPSSPKHGWGRKESLTDGDMHYWGVWWGREPFAIYDEKVGRFMSEYGFQGYPAYATLEEVIPENDRYVGAPSMLIHQKHPFGEELIRDFMGRSYPVPTSDSLEQYVYLSQLTQAYGIRTAMEAHRRSVPYCMGTLYWQLNDSWPAISWSGLDYYGRWKALHYFAKRAFEDLLVCAQEDEGILKVFLVNDLNRDISGKAEIKLLDFNGKVITVDTASRIAAKNSSLNIYSESVMNVIGDNDPKRVFMKISFISGKDSIADNTWFFTPHEELALSRPDISVEVRKEKKEVLIILRSVGLVKDLYLDFRGFEGRFSDNFFDLLPGEARQITFYPAQHDHLPDQANLKLFSLYDVLSK